MKYIIKIFVLLCFLLAEEKSFGQFLTELEGIDIKQSSKEISKISKIMSKYTYAFCSIDEYTEDENNGSYEILKVSDLYNIIGLYTDIDTTYAHKIVLERVTYKKNKTYYKQFKTSVLLNQTIDNEKVWDFFASLDTYKFHKLDNKCLTNMTFTNPEDSIYPLRKISITHLRDDRILLLAHNKLREIRSSAPRTVFLKYPDQNSCRAIFII